MNRNYVLVTALAAGIATLPLSAQTPAAAPAAAPAAVEPQAVPAKIAAIDFEGVVLSTNEAQRALADLQKKYETRENQIKSLASEVDSLRKQEQALPSTTSDSDRAKLLRDIDTKEKQLQLDGNALQEAEQSDGNEAMSKIMPKVGATAVKYSQDHGFTLIVDIGRRQGPNPVLWWQPSSDISQAVVNAYNQSSGIAPPPPSSPTPQRSSTPRPGAAAPAKK